MHQPPHRALAALAAAALVVLGGAGCTTAVIGTPQADGSTDAAADTELPSLAPTAAPGSELPIVDAGLADDCLLAPEQLAALAGLGSAYAEQTAVTQSDGQTVDSCFYFETGGFVPRGRVQVYSPAPGATVAAAMDQVTGAPVPGVGDRAVLVRTAAQEVLWAAAGERIATVRLSEGLSATDAAFTTAGQQALAALATR